MSYERIVMEEHKMLFIDTAGIAHSDGQDDRHYIELFNEAKRRQVSAVVVCSSSDTIDLVTQQSLKTCLALYGEACLAHLIFVVSKNPMDEMTLEMWEDE